MKFSIRGSLEIRIPDDVTYEIEADSKDEAIEGLVQQLIDDGELVPYSNAAYLRLKVVKKTFKVEVSQTFKNTIFIDTDDYPDIEDEDEAARYVEDHIEEFDTELEFDDCTQETCEASCNSLDTQEEETDYYE